MERSGLVLKSTHDYNCPFSTWELDKALCSLTLQLLVVIVVFFGKNLKVNGQSPACLDVRILEVPYFQYGSSRYQSTFVKLTFLEVGIGYTTGFPVKVSLFGYIF